MRDTAPVLLLGLLAVVGCDGAGDGGATTNHGATPANSGVGAAGATPAGGAVEEDRPYFVEVAAAAGIEFVHFNGAGGLKYFIETMGGGCVLFDYDGDGDLDAYLVQSGPVPGETSELDARSHLFRNDGTGVFERVTDAAGVGNSGSYGMGAAAADYDNDGNIDLYIANFEGNRLYRNQGDGTFADVTDEARVADPLWSVSAAWADFDGDGLLDLYVVNYLDFTMDNNKWCGRNAEKIRAYCHPDQYNGVQPRLYVNQGDGTFADRTVAAGLMKTNGKGLGVVVADLDGDGDPDMFGANDSTINYIWVNRGDGTFDDYSLISGAGYNEDGKPQACMGADAGDYDRDGDFDLYTTNLDLEYNTLYQNAGDGDVSLSDSTYRTGLAESHLLYVGFGTEFLDYDLDGWLDLLIANGHIIDNIAEMNDSLNYAQPKSLFRNMQGKRFDEVSAGMKDMEANRVSRGLAVGDIDDDGDLDFLVGSNNMAAELYRNEGGGHGGFVSIELEGRASNRQGIGARLTLVAGAARQHEEVRAGTSYGSSSDPRVTFGLGAAQGIDELEVRWPSGLVQKFEKLPANAWLRVIEGEAAPRIVRRLTDE